MTERTFPPVLPARLAAALEQIRTPMVSLSEAAGACAVILAEFHGIDAERVERAVEGAAQRAAIERAHQRLEELAASGAGLHECAEAALDYLAAVAGEDREVIRERLHGQMTDALVKLYEPTREAARSLFDMVRSREGVRDFRTDPPRRFEGFAPLEPREESPALVDPRLVESRSAKPER